MTNSEQTLRDMKLAIDDALAQYQLVSLFNKRMAEENKVLVQIRDAINIHELRAMNLDELSGFELAILDIMNRYERRLEEEKWQLKL